MGLPLPKSAHCP